MSGFLIRRLLKYHNCEQCLIVLTDFEPDLDSKTVYLRQRAYVTKSGNCALRCASNIFADYISQCEATFLDLYAKHQSECGVISVIVTELLKISLPAVCPQFPMKKFLQLFVRIRIFYTLKFQNRALIYKKFTKKSKQLKRLEKYKNI